MGEVIFKRSTKAKHLIIRVKEDLNITVSVPKNITLKRAIDFVKYQENRILKTIINIKKKKNIDKENAIDLIPIEKAKEMIIKRVTFLAKIHNFEFNKISVKNQKTIWGSCSVKNNLNFNYKIASLPKELTDYIIFHELVHTRIKNHGKNFWDSLDTYIPDSRSFRKKLRKIRFKAQL
jgi:predicted metal-dependent hydrolase